MSRDWRTRGAGRADGGEECSGRGKGPVLFPHDLPRREGQALGCGDWKDPLSHSSGPIFPPGRHFLVTGWLLAVPSACMCLVLGSLPLSCCYFALRGLPFGKHFQFLCLFLGVTPGPTRSPFPHAFRFVNSNEMATLLSPPGRVCFLLGFYHPFLGPFQSPACLPFIQTTSLSLTLSDTPVLSDAPQPG